MFDPCRNHDGNDRRNFLRFLVGGTAGLGLLPAPLWSAAERSAAGRTGAVHRGKACIVLWLGGGASQLETFDPKPGENTGGPVKSIPTTVDGIQLSEYLPQLAKQQEHFSILRSVTSTESGHPRGLYLMHTGYAPIPGLPFAPMGTVCSHELRCDDFPLPSFLALSPPDIPHSEVFGDAHLPFSVRKLDDPIPNLRPPVKAGRRGTRRRLLGAQDESFLSGRSGRAIERRTEASQRALDLMTTPLLKAFRIEDEPEAVRKRYGGRFGQQCLLARRLVNVGVPFVEIGLGGWDTHNNNFDRTKKLCGHLDAALANLLADLAASGQLEETLILCLGEFGRTPVINRSKGRDHWTKCWSVAIAGGGVQGGRVIGATDKTGMAIARRPVPVEHLFATAYEALGIDPRTKYDVQGRKVKYAYNGKPIQELFS
jgi:hypothetical protein